MEIRQLPIDDASVGIVEMVKPLIGGDIITLLRLTTLRCGTTEEWIGADETYLKFSFDPALARLDAAAQDVLKNAVAATGLGVLVLEVPADGIPFDTGVLGDGDSADLDLLLPVVAGMTIKVEQGSTSPGSRSRRSRRPRSRRTRWTSSTTASFCSAATPPTTSSATSSTGSAPRRDEDAESRTMTSVRAVRVLLGTLATASLVVWPSVPLRPTRRPSPAGLRSVRWCLLARPGDGRLQHGGPAGGTVSGRGRRRDVAGRRRAGGGGPGRHPGAGAVRGGGAYSASFEVVGDDLHWSPALRVRGRPRRRRDGQSGRAAARPRAGRTRRRSRTPTPPREPEEASPELGAPAGRARRCGVPRRRDPAGRAASRGLSQPAAENGAAAPYSL